ncbi:MAG TPA: GAF domain-containing sensor histidine kinase [Dehalococcoidia bacterium]|nr:GAF domain-containing sensor histidine kinase [Dehalococcoidia bacterium]
MKKADTSLGGRLTSGLGWLRWATIIVPAVVLIAFDYLRHFVLPFEFLHGWSGFLLLWGLVLAGVLVFSQAVFSIIGKMERQVLRHNKELEATAATATALGQTLKLQEVLEVALNKALDITGVQAGVVCVLDEVRQELVHLAHRGLSEEVLGPLNRVKLSMDPIGAQVVETGSPVIMRNLWDDPRVAEVARKAGFRSAVSVPLLAEGKVMGVIALASAQERCFSPSEVAMLLGIGSQLGMAVRNAVLFEDLLKRNREEFALNSISTAVSSSLDLNDVMVAAIDSVMELMEAEAGEIWLVEEKGNEVALAVHRGAFPESFREIERFPLGEGFPGRAALTGQPMVTQNLAEEVLYLRESVKELNFHFFACLPLKSRGNVLGTLDIASRQQRELTSRDLQLLSSIGSIIGVAIDNAALHQKVQNYAVLVERERIAREMHDGLAQILGYVNTKTQAAKKLLSQGQVTQAEEALRQLEEAAREVYADVREAILGLRATTSSSHGLVHTVREYLEWFSRQNSIQAEVMIEGEPIASLEPSLEIQLIRIVQEALSNVRKHARAQKTWVQFSSANGHLCLAVSDDGQGFDPERVARGLWPQFGLQTMRERAESIGGTFDVSSAPGQGTTVKVTVPKGACVR